MKFNGNRVLLRLGGVMLLVLVLSPFTAPFSTCDLSDLFGDTTSDGGAILQSKPAPQEPTPALTGIVDLQELRNHTSRNLVRVIRHSCSLVVFQIPLRI